MNFDWRCHWWRWPLSDGQHLKEDDLYLDSSIDGKRPWMKDNLQWEMKFDNLSQLCDRFWDLFLPHSHVMVNFMLFMAIWVVSKCSWLHQAGQIPQHLALRFPNILYMTLVVNDAWIWTFNAYLSNMHNLVFNYNSVFCSFYWFFYISNICSSKVC